ncbi:MAG: hypothetical protein Q7T62_16030 [Undibacterium sp.]|nr:hypothetical protein [Undibacterium sp.]
MKAPPERRSAHLNLLLLTKEKHHLSMRGDQHGSASSPAATTTVIKFKKAARHHAMRVRPAGQSGWRSAWIVRAGDACIEIATKCHTHGADCDDRRRALLFQGKTKDQYNPVKRKPSGDN